jgi:asparagine synthase (glutamine-hydrolysing)
MQGREALIICGIAGMVGFEDRHLLVRMNDALRHRGPDDSGVYVDESVALANRRLSIIDLPGGHQPIHNEGGTVWVTFNGEIYNYHGLRSDLEKKGHRFYTNSDTETIVHLYEEYGDGCVKNLRGMFAFALWDSPSKRLLLARDRIGIKPLYYCRTDNGMLFASEIKSILQDEEVPRTVSIQAIDWFLALRYVPGNSTILSHVKRLEPGHIAAYKDGEMHVSRYWDFLTVEAPARSEQGWLDGLADGLREAVHSELVSDVPLGAFLSGGIDSSIVVALMSSMTDEAVKTFSVGFGEGEEVDELRHARVVADHFETDHHELIVKEDAMKLLPEIVWYGDEPVADPAMIPTYLVSELARRHVKVVLTGEGGDEMFAGYIQYKAVLMGKRYISKIPKSVRTWLAPRLLRSIPGSFLDLFFSYSSALGEEAKRRIADYVSNSDDPTRAYLSIVSIFDEKERQEILQESVISQLKGGDLSEIISSYLCNQPVNELLGKLMQLESKTELVDNLLLKTDRMTMAHSLEARVPYLDHKLVEYTCSMPSKLKLRGLKDKYALRKVMSDQLPRITARRKKHRFFVPIDQWLDRSLTELANQVLSKEVLRRRGYLKIDQVERIFRNFNRSKLYHSRQIWSLLTLELWQRAYVDRDIPRGPPRPL